jgi:three-Cys-motif partner protein
MPSRHERRFFDQRRSWSELKHKLLEYYLVPWSAKVGSTNNEIVVVDPFAGAGYYGTGVDRVEGSPVIAVRRAEEYERRYPGRRMHVICVEHNDEHYGSLVDAVGGSTARPTLIHGDFEDHVGDIAELMAQHPALVLLDPIGLVAIQPDTCNAVLLRSAKTDLFIIIHFAVVFRIGGMLGPDLEPRSDLSTAPALVRAMDRFFGCADWRDIARATRRPVDERSRALLELYFQNVLRNRYPYISTYPVRDHVGGGTKYWIVHASAHRDGLKLVNDAVVVVDRELARRSYPVGLGNYLPGLEPDPIRRRIEDVERLVKARAVEHLGTNGCLPFATLEALLVDEFFGRAKYGDYARLVKELVRQGALAREETRPAAKLRPSERIRLPRDGGA